MRNAKLLSVYAAVSLAVPNVALSEDVPVSDAAGLRRALTAAGPGTTILVAPGAYEGGISARGLRGEAGRPVVLRAADPGRPPVFEGGPSGFHLSNVAYLELRDLVVTEATGNGVNVDDAGSAETPSRHVLLKGLAIRDIGPGGNRDGIKLSGVEDFRLEGCVVERWGDRGSGVDMVGCRRGEVVGCTFRHADDKGDHGVQTKGGSRDIAIRRCRFEHAGQRAVNLGGSTGAAYFRPGPEGYEAKDVSVEDCTIVGSLAPVAFVGVDGASVSHNTIYRPRRWGFCVLQENRAPGFVPCRGGRFTDNVVAFRSDEMAVPANVGPGTAAETFSLARNVWYCLDAPARSRPRLPVPEADGVYGIDPGFRDAQGGDLRTAADGPAAAAGVRVDVDADPTDPSSGSTAEPGAAFGDNARTPAAEADGTADRPNPARTGRVRVVGRSLVDDGGPFLGLGASYFTALWRCKHDRPRLESDLAFLSRNGFDSVRVLSMVGHHPAWVGLEVAPVSFTSRDGRRVEAWPDYWQQLRELIDVAHDRHGLRTELTVFADAQLMPDRADRLRHLDTFVTDVLPGREHKLLLVEVANEAWQNGFPRDEGVADLREFAAYLGDRTDVPVAVTSDHDRGGDDPFGRLYAGGVADLATWHFSRDRRADGGWRPVVDCWELAGRPGFPPVVSNEPIGPGSSVDAETDPARLVAAAAFAYAAGLPAYVFHSEAGVFGRARFEETPGVDRFEPVLRLLPVDLPGWERHDGKDPGSPLTIFAGGEPGRYVSDVESAADGCVRMAACRKGDRFVAVPVGVRPGGLTVEARQALRLTAYDLLTGQEAASASLSRGERMALPPGPGALILVGRVEAGRVEPTDAPDERR